MGGTAVWCRRLAYPVGPTDRASALRVGRRWDRSTDRRPTRRRRPHRQEGNRQDETDDDEKGHRRGQAGHPAGLGQQDLRGQAEVVAEGPIWALRVGEDRPDDQRDAPRRHESPGGEAGEQPTWRTASWRVPATTFHPQTSALADEPDPDDEQPAGRVRPYAQRRSPLVGSWSARTIRAAVRNTPAVGRARNGIETIPKSGQPIATTTTRTTAAPQTRFARTSRSESK